MLPNAHLTRNHASVIVIVSLKPSTMNDQETKCFLLKAILMEANKNRVCPVCDIPYVDAKHALAHCRDKAKQNPTDSQHKGIGCVNTSGGFWGFLTSLREAIGWPDMPESELPLTRGEPGPPAYGDCLKISWIVKMKTRTGPSFERVLLQRIVQKAKIHYACPICLHGSATGSGLLQHCSEVNDAGHAGLLSEHEDQFLEHYEKAMGRTLKDTAIRFTYCRRGNPKFEDCFEVEEILKFKCKALISDTTNRC